MRLYSGLKSGRGVPRHYLLRRAYVCYTTRSCVSAQDVRHRKLFDSVEYACYVRGVYLEKLCISERHSEMSVRLYCVEA